MSLLGTVGKICCQRGEIEFDWKVRSFTLLSEDDDDFYNSHPFEFGGRFWYLELCPNGETRYDSKGYISLFLMPRSTGPPVEVLFSVGVKTAKGETEMWWSTKKTYKDKRGYGISKYILRSELLRRRDELLPLDVLTIRVKCKAGILSLDVSVQTEVEDTTADEEKGGPSEKTGNEKILQDVRMLWESGDNSDVIIRVRDVEFKAHKTILAARAPVLRAMFQQDTAERDSGEITIDDCEPEVFEQIMHYIYTGAPRVLTAENASALYFAADKYSVNEVKVFCVRCMQDTLCVENFCNTVKLSLMYREHELLEITIDFLSKNVTDVMKTVAWQMFLREHSARANEILIRALELEATRRKKCGWVNSFSWVQNSYIGELDLAWRITHLGKWVLGLGFWKWVRKWVHILGFEGLSTR